MRVRPTTRGQQQQRRRRQRQGGMCMFRFLYWGGGKDARTARPLLGSMDARTLKRRYM